MRARRRLLSLMRACDALGVFSTVIDCACERIRDGYDRLPISFTRSDRGQVDVLISSCVQIE